MVKKIDIPQIHFPEFTGKWQIQKLGNLFFNRRERGNIDLAIFSVTQNQGLILRNLLDRKMEDSANPTDNLCIEPNDIVYNMMRMWQGAYGRATQKGMVSPAYVVLKPTENVNSLFYMYYFERSKSRHLFTSYSYGLTSDRLRLYFKDFSEIKFHCPTYAEQTRIANFIESIDKRISLLKQKKNLLEQYKKGVMQKLFSQELRFKDENGKEFPKWEKKRLGEVLDYEQPTNYLVSSTEYNDKFETPVVTAGKTFILGYTDETIGIFKENLPVIIFDDFTTATQFVNFSFKAKSSAMKILKAKDNSNIKFLYEAMQMIDYEIGGHGRHWISVFAEMEILIPCIKEQTKIANFLTALDEKINRTENQLQQTQAYKKGLLQKMFV